jgi:peptidoglycan/xylan/chitin deacetylase (PgdA/CDA1 family)
MSGGPSVDRDFEGYGGTPPNANWPNNARIAVNIVINFEEGSEPSVPDGDTDSETGLIETGGKAFSGRDLAAESMFEYGSRAGFWRLLKTLQHYNSPVTFFACSEALARNPRIAHAVREGAQSGIYDLCGHGARWERHQGMSLEKERAVIASAYDKIEALTGSAPLGWYCRYAPTENTRRIVVEHGGFLYDSDAYNDDLPYWVSHGGKQHLVVPYTQVTNDAKFVRGAVATSADFEQVLQDQFNVLYDEGEHEPKMMTIGLHCRLAGHPFRAASLARFLESIAKNPKVWLCRRADIAHHWIKHFPAKPAEAS